VSVFTSSLITGGMLVIIYTELVLFFSLFARISYGENTYLYNASSFLVIGVIIILSCASIANSLFATLLCKELMTTSLTKLFFNVTGLHFSHVIIGYFMLLHTGDTDATIYTTGTRSYLVLTQQEAYFTGLYWYLVEGLWLVIDALVFMLYS
jgi:heme/copper-type cytochrome/quinol oxidase subunit 3